MPWLAGRVDTLSSFDDVKLLDVQLNRLHRWYSDGALCIGDAAHAMSPVGGVGINLAVADAVATARLLADPLRSGRVSTRQLARVQVRRWVPTAIIQAVQRAIHANVVAVAVSGGRPKALAAVRLLSRTPALGRLMGYGWRSARSQSTRPGSPGARNKAPTPQLRWWTPGRSTVNDVGMVLHAESSEQPTNG